MISTKELSALLATLYAAPLEPENWQVFFDHLCTLTDTSSGYMVSVRPEAGNVLLAGGGLNFDLETLHLYNEHYGANDPYTAPVMANPRVGIIPGEELVNRSDLVRSELYNELLRPFNLEHMTLASCGWSTEEAVLFPLWRSARQGSMEANSICLLESLLPHMQTALRLRAKVLAFCIAGLFSEATLDVLSIAALLVTGKGRVRQMNQRAASLIQSAGGSVSAAAHSLRTTL